MTDCLRDILFTLLSEGGSSIHSHIVLFTFYSRFLEYFLSYLACADTISSVEMENYMYREI